MANFYKAPTSNYWSSTTNGAVDAAVQTITLTSTVGLQAPGVIVLDREDGNGTATPNSREIVSYTGISGNDLTGCTRGAESSTARSHGTGALVEAVFTVTQWNDLRDAVNTAFAGVAAGTSLLVSTATITTLTGTSLLASTATITTLNRIVVKNSLVTIASAGTVNINLNTGNSFHIGMPDSAMTLTTSNANEGQVFMVDIKQRNQTSAPSITWFDTISWTGGTKPTLTSTANKTDTLGFKATSSNTFSGYIVGQNI